MDQRTKKSIASLHPNAQAWARAHFQAIEQSGVLPDGYTVRFLSGNRTWKEQDELYAKGRTEPGEIVTNARGGQSNHNFGIAWDIGIFDEKDKYLGESLLYAKLGPVGEEIGLEWGGRWRGFPDRPHYQVRTGLTTSELRRLVVKGKPIPVPIYGQGPMVKPSDEVKIFDGTHETTIPAFIEGGRVWVAVRPFVNRFGGSVAHFEAPAKFTVHLHDEVVSMEGTVRDGVGYAKFADLNRVMDWGFTYEAKRLVVLTVKER